GSGIMAERLTQDTGLALLANTAATAAGLVVLISTFGPVSGAHFNPAVTMISALRRETSAGIAAAYVLAQTAGAVAGVWLAHLMFAEPVIQVSARLRDSPGQALSEGVATFGLIGVILAGGRFQPQSAPALVGLYIGAAYWFTASTSFANPAVTLARTLSDTFAGIAPSSAPAFVAAQIVGALLALIVFGWILGKENTP
ncbi:MAG TPA: MIP/aquaporin family protein, partial [Brevundimonas sp.]|nr:MIP/aquaporin family protein [Brevundimonas sp.]